MYITVHTDLKAGLYLKKTEPGSLMGKYFIHKQYSSRFIHIT